MSEHDEKSLPVAIGKLLSLNNYDVEYSVKIAGAEVDIVASPRGNPFSPKIYIEATIQYVDNTKYGKDTTKFILIKEIDSAAICISISLRGFTPDVIERAKHSKIRTETYTAFFKHFEQFAPYASKITSQDDLINLVGTYEPPLLSDKTGTEAAIDWFDAWQKNDDGRNWVILLGEYGTGKTALTKYLQHRWLLEYEENPTLRIPLRIELREFTRQFDADSLLHHFLDKNSLSHIPISYLKHLIRTGRVVLLLDGYDEMAQFMNVRERRLCLSALTSLASDGAKGILTSRPNYFTESEELGVFEALYATIERGHYHIGASDRKVIDEEKLVDKLLENYILSKMERTLRDLNPAQTESLISRKLGDDVDGKAIVLSILSNTFRREGSGAHQSLSGKPVIVSYLLELIDDLKSDPDIYSASLALTEFMVYKMIVDRLMMRDHRRSPSMHPDDRRACLQHLAVLLSQRNNPSAAEDDFFSIVDSVFKTNLLRYTGEERRSYRDQLFQDVRSSATLTRGEDISIDGAGWRFSHNSLREYLVLERILSLLNAEQPFRNQIAISDLMRQFFASRTEAEISRSFAKLKAVWTKGDYQTTSTYLSAAWRSIENSPRGAIKALADIFLVPGNGTISMANLSLSMITIDGGMENPEAKIDFSGAVLSDAVIKNLDLSGSTFADSILESLEIRNCDLLDTKFANCIFLGVTFDNVSFNKADFRGLDKSSEVYIRSNTSSKSEALSGDVLLGYLSYNDAITDQVNDYYVIMNHPKFSIAAKICSNITDQRKSQLRGLTQRGSAQTDPIFARKFVSFLQAKSLISINQHNLVSVTDGGRGPLTRFVKHNEVFSGLKEFFEYN